MSAIVYSETFAFIVLLKVVADKQAFDLISWTLADMFNDVVSFGK